VSVPVDRIRANDTQQCVPVRRPAFVRMKGLGLHPDCDRRRCQRDGSLVLTNALPCK